MLSWTSHSQEHSRIIFHLSVVLCVYVCTSTCCGGPLSRWPTFFSSSNPARARKQIIDWFDQSRCKFARPNAQLQFDHELTLTFADGGRLNICRKVLFLFFQIGPGVRNGRGGGLLKGLPPSKCQMRDKMEFTARRAHAASPRCDCVAAIFHVFKAVGDGGLHFGL